MTDLERFVTAWCDPPRDELQRFLAEGRPRHLAAGAFFCRPGQTAHEMGFLHEGLGRYHLLPASGDDITKDFALPGRFCVSFGSAVLGQPAQVAISAVTACRLTVWPFERVRALFDSHLEWARLGRRVAELLYVRKERREVDFLVKSAAERYETARVELGPVMNELPRAVLASYLGIAPESLSRLRRRLFTAKRRKG